MVKHKTEPTSNNFAAREKPHPVTGGVKVDEARYVLKLSPALDASLTKMAQRMDMDKGKAISHSLTMLALAMENKRREGGDIALLNKKGEISRVIPVNDNGFPGDLEIAKEGESEESPSGLDPRQVHG